MSHSDKALQQEAFTFDHHTLHVLCRRLPAEVSRVTQTLQLDVEELFANLLDWDTGPPALPTSGSTAAASAAGPGDGSGGGGGSGGGNSTLQQRELAAAAPPDSKKLCGNVADDQPDLIGLDVWPAAIALCEYLARWPYLAAGAAVCELGAGMGLPGLLCAKLGAAQVLLTDYEPVVVEQMRQNAGMNALQQLCSFLTLDWFDLAPLAPAQRHAYDLLLLADVIYAAAVVQPLVQTLLALLKPSGVALVAHRIRRPLIFDRVEKIARLQEQDEIFQEFKAACQQAGLQLRFLNDSPAARAGDDPVLLVIGASLQQLQRFPALEGPENSSIPSVARGVVGDCIAVK